MTGQHPVFVENGEDARETATILVGTAAEYGLDRRSIQATHDGFFITTELAALVYDEEEPEADTKATKTSGNRAAKKTGSKEE